MVNQTRLVNTFLKLVKIDSPSGQEKPVGDFVIALLKKIGLKAKRDKVGNVLTAIPGPNPILLNAHLDTIKSSVKVKPVINNGLIGTNGQMSLGADNKAGLAAVIEALRYINSPIEAVFTVSEETDLKGAFNLDYSVLKAKHGFCFDCGEPLGTIILASPFYDGWEIIVKGKPCHAAFPEKGINALKLAGSIINQLKFGKLDDSTVFNIGVIDGGRGKNIVPGEIKMIGEMRSFDKQKLENYKKSIKKTLSFSKVKIERENDGYVFKKSEVAGIAKTLKASGLKVRYIKSWACSDANVFNARGLKMVNLGEGIRNIHGLQESIKIKDLVKLSELIIKLADLRLN